MHQGSALSPYLFSVIMDEITKELQKLVYVQTVKKYKKCLLRNLAYTDRHGQWQCLKLCNYGNCMFIKFNTHKIVH